MKKARKSFILSGYIHFHLTISEIQENKLRSIKIMKRTFLKNKIKYIPFHEN